MSTEERKGFLSSVFQKKNRSIEAEMSFFDHLEELRWRFLRSLIAVVVLALVAFNYKEIIFDMILLGPKNPDFWTYKALCFLSAKFNLDKDLCVEKINFTLQNLEMAGQFLKHLSISIITGFILAFPYIFWEFWGFIKPALSPKELKYTNGIIFYVTILFAMGVLFGYFVVTPLSVVFLGSYTLSEQISNQISLNSYISLVTTLSLAVGAVFELPIVVYFLSKIGLVTPGFMRQYRKHAYIFILILAGFITPSPDVTTQMMVTFPMILLYEVSIMISRRVEKQQLKSEL
jgi:sec-independent protein translocase protein TatC